MKPSIVTALNVIVGQFQILFALLQIPYWVLYHLPQSRRPISTWSLYKCVTVRVMRIVSKAGMNMANQGINMLPTHRSVPWFPKTKHVWLEPTPEFVNGDLKTWASISGVHPTRIPGYWVDRRGHDTPVNHPPRPEEKVLYYLHGGGYITQSANPAYDMTSAIATHLLDCHPSFKRSFAVEYRLTRPGENPFPTALLDALAGYVYLVNIVGFSPRNIVVYGDSAGGNLSLALTRYLVEQARVPDSPVPAPPDALLLFSPWADMGTSHSSSPDSTFFTNRSTDFLPDHDSGVLLTARTNFCGPHKFPDAANSNPYLSPASMHPAMKSNGYDNSFKGFPRTYIIAGDAEILLGQIRSLKEKMAKDLGENRLGYHEGKGGVHDFVLFGPWSAESELVYAHIANWFADSEER